jgi:hypothetical protein
MGGGEMVGTLVAQQPQAQPGLLVAGIQRYNVGEGGLGISGAATLQQQAGQIESGNSAMPARKAASAEASAARLGRHAVRRRASTGLRHVGTPAALAADLLGDEVDQFAGLELAGQIGGDAGDQADLAVAALASTTAALFSLSLSLSSVSRRPRHRRLPWPRPAP